MPKKTPDEVVLETYVRQDLSLSALTAHLEEKFGESAPDRSTVARHLKKFKEQPPEELAEDRPFVWAEAHEKLWAGDRSILDAIGIYNLHDLHTLIGPFTHRTAKWVYRVSLAIEPWSGPDNGDKTCDVLDLAQDYAASEIYAMLQKKPLDTTRQDLFLACKPWTDLNALCEFWARLHPQGSTPGADLKGRFLTGAFERERQRLQRLAGYSQVFKRGAGGDGTSTPPKAALSNFLADLPEGGLERLMEIRECFLPSQFLEAIGHMMASTDPRSADDIGEFEAYLFGRGPWWVTVILVAMRGLTPVEFAEKVLEVGSKERSDG